MQQQPSANQDQGSALIWAILFSIIVSGMIVSHAVYVSAHRREMDARYHRSSLSGTFARSGMTDALSWFQSRAEQPVQAFSPVLNPSATPPIADTEDPDLGLVREFEIRGNLWGRYEVRKDETLDVSRERGVEDAGSVWEIGARGIVYRKIDPAKPYNVRPNRIISTSVMRTEIRGVKLQMPAPAAVIINSPSDVNVQGNGAVAGATNPAFAYSDTSVGDLPIAPLGTIDGVPATVNIPGFNITPQRLFSMVPAQLQDFSDEIVAGGGALPGAAQVGKVLFVKGDLTLANGQSFRGQNTLIYVDGNLNANVGNDTQMTGMVYVKGNATIRGPFALRGMMVVGGSLTLGGSAAPATISYDDRSVQDLTRVLSAYRMSRVKQPGVGTIEPTGDTAAEIAPSSFIEPTVTYGQFLVVEEDVQILGPATTIGDNVRIGMSTLIQDSVQIGDNARIMENVHLHGDAIVLPGRVVEPGMVLGPGEVY